MATLHTWTTQQLINLGRWLVNAFGFGFKAAQPTATRDTWTPESLANFGLEMSKGFGSGL
jgi:hypothetical protein